ncbi:MULTISPECIES: hypothetical protein [Pseudonocardia]|uniref:Secreted protein n=2 Tax=Pseudonocardia TaxID=1847 RepID=A0A1Y2N601_PSEAH|nr:MULTISPECIES: hypothetical protein [Pseudonocardia]OSY42348.1 hypothetical protein BG845_01268 [Pseudonocardia autotrophica]TDN75868.1 hypothetical protein C8E95_5053 [Pseudonocardia autotrophica]BBF99839.1 hypothetical protein Pdca_10490 [Pseudonocardia autotrophica]GEC27575.1 hypothetical protein PSA01_46040 [Pseudonocardia saturnea]
MTRLRTTAPLLLAAALTALAVTTVQGAGCDDPGHYEPGPDGSWSLVGGCVEPGDLVVAPPPTVTDPASTPEQSRS